MEKLILAVKILKGDKERITYRLLAVMIKKNIKGFATQVKDAAVTFGYTLDELIDVNNIRSVLKKKVLKLQAVRIEEEMMRMSKTDSLLLQSFVFDGRKKKYLELPFPQARIIFIVRCRMLPTKDNFKGRWNGFTCNICGKIDTDAHLFQCCGYSDLVVNICYEMFFTLKDGLDVLYEAANTMIKVKERLDVVQELSSY